MGVVISGSVSAAYARIPDRYKNFDEVVSALQNAGMTTSQLLVGIDYTKSNLASGTRCHEGKSLHYVGRKKHRLKNPYEQAFKMIADALSPFDADQLFPIYGFGDAHTGNSYVFAFEMDEPPRDVKQPFPLIRAPREMPCEGLEAALERYLEVTEEVSLGGPTSFAPIIRQAIWKIREASANQHMTPAFHILLIIADGQISKEDKMVTEAAINEASYYPLSIICVGVGDGPWDLMEKYDEKLRNRCFDNFQFVDFNTVFAKYPYIKRKEAFAVHALQQVPSQYRACRMLGYLQDDWEMPKNFKMPPKPLGPPDMLREAPADDPSYSFYAAVNPSFGVLDSWTAVYDHKQQTYFYMNKETGETLWDKPTLSIYCPPKKRGTNSEFSRSETDSQYTHSEHGSTRGSTRG